MRNVSSSPSRNQSDAALLGYYPSNRFFRDTFLPLDTVRTRMAAAAMRKNTILVVDDRDDDLVLLKRMFKKAGLLNELQAVSTISDAMSYLEGKGRYSDREKFPFPILMLLDMHLPDGSAFNLLNWLSQKHGRSPAAVVVLTGSDVGAIRQSYELGAHSFLTKPLRFEDFQHMVAHVRGIKLTSTSEGSYLEAD